MTTSSPLDVPSILSTGLVTAIDHVGIAVPDLDAAIEWYHEHLGMILVHEEINEEQGAQTGGAFGGAAAGFYQYFDSRVTVDVNAEYRINRNLALFANARNLFDEPQDLLRENANTPGYASQYQREELGVQITVGLKGSF